MLFFVTENAEPQSKLGKKQGTSTVVSYRTGDEKKPWKNLSSLSATLPSRYIFDVHLGSTVVPFRLLKPWRAVLPINDQRILTDEQIDNADDGLRSWWSQATDLWEKNKTKQSKLSLMERLDYQNTLSKQLNAVKHRVVYSKSGNTLAAARISTPHTIIDHKLYWMPANGISEARFLSAILNAPVTTKMVSIYQSRGLFGTRDFDKNVWRLPIPKYSPKNALHQEIVALAEEAELIASQVDTKDYKFKKVRAIVRNELSLANVSVKLDAAVKALLNGA
ncbi:hypothetical protein [Corynebacterium anserum]|uniref:Uncharacterized protein n=1 Tax=Corynebacterium anserum TaxID=2684406 RepID=A0A7G7YM19_9CORY|nr:hypothetical protein [Corynebacterium anserum]QNH95539.1 hypothetical protein GP473_01455 [Corynebacterium anserum]